MGSVLDWIECPKCGQEGCSSDFYYKTGEEYINCGECGYYRSVTIKEDSREKKLSELTEDDWQMVELVNPWGSYRLKENGAIATLCGSLANKEDYEELIKNVNENIESVDQLVLSRCVEGKIVKVMVVESSKVINEIIP